MLVKRAVNISAGIMGAEIARIKHGGIEIVGSGIMSIKRMCVWILHRNVPFLEKMR